MITVTLHSAKISKRRVSSCSASLHLNYVCVLFANYTKVLHSGHVQTRITAVSEQVFISVHLTFQNWRYWLCFGVTDNDMTVICILFVVYVILEIC